MALTDGFARARLLTDATGLTDTPVSLSRRALRRRAVLFSRRFVSPSMISAAARVVLSIGVSGRGSGVLNSVVPVSVAIGQSP